MLKTYRPTGTRTCTLIRLTGPDSQDFLHRITTVHVKALQPGQGGPGCLLNAQGRFRAYFHLWCVSATEFALEVEGGRDDHWVHDLLAAIDQYTFAEKIEIGPQPLQCAWLIGESPLAPAMVAAAAHVFRRGTHELGQPLTSVWAKDIGTWLTTQAPGAHALSDEDVERLRIHALQPRVDHEITDTANPLELGLNRAIADNKGCYPGQEVIEKIVSLGEPARKLVRIEGSGTAPTLGSAIELNEEASGPALGSVSSAATQGDRFTALALVRKTQAREGATLKLGDGRTGTITGVAKHV